MFHVVIMLIATCFGCTLYYFYAFSGTNLLTRCQSASSVFPAVFGFRKFYTENIVKIGGNLFLRTYNIGKLPESEDHLGGGPRGPHPMGARPRVGPRPARVWGPGGSSPGALWTPEASRTHIYGRKDFVQFRGYFPCRISETKNSRKQGTGTLASC